MKLNINCGMNPLEGFENVDSSPITSSSDPEILYYDPETPARNPLPFPADHAEVITIDHSLNSIKNPLPFLEDLYRVAKHECQLIIRCPMGSSAEAFDKPNDVRQLYPSSFYYYGQPAYEHKHSDYSADWATEEVALLIHPTINKRLRDNGISLPFAVHHLHNVVHEMIAILIAIKPSRERDMSLQIPIKPVITTMQDGDEVSH